MKITDGEKLILAMLSELYDKLGVDGEIDADFVRSAIFGDALWSLPWKYPGIPFEDQETPEVVKEVLDILDMWSAIEYGYEHLSQEDKAQLEQEAHPFGATPKFPGFDGNNETEQLATALFIVNKLDRFVEFKDRYLNSHGPVLDSYRRMLPMFKIIRRTSASGLLSKRDLAAILLERTHPDFRK